MSNTRTIAQMESDLAAQIAWGKWNVAPLANELHRAKIAALSPMRRKARAIAGYLFDRLILCAGFALFIAPLVLRFT